MNSHKKATPVEPEDRYNPDWRKVGRKVVFVEVIDRPAHIVGGEERNPFIAVNLYKGEIVQSKEGTNPELTVFVYFPNEMNSMTEDDNSILPIGVNRRHLIHLDEAPFFQDMQLCARWFEKTYPGKDAIFESISDAFRTFLAEGG